MQNLYKKIKIYKKSVKTKNRPFEVFVFIKTKTLKTFFSTPGAPTCRHFSKFGQLRG